MVGCIWLANIFDILNKHRSVVYDVTIFLQLSSTKIIFIIIEMMPFIILITASLFFNQLTASRELIAFYSIRLSVWQVLTPIIFTNIVIGILTITLLQPASAMLLRVHNKIENKLYNKSSEEVLVSNIGLMFIESYNEGKAIFILKQIDLKSKKAKEVRVLVMDSDHSLVERIDAKEAYFGQFVEFVDVNIYKKSNSFLSEKVSDFNMDLSVSPDRIHGGNIEPEYYALWRLKEVMLRLKNAGISVSKYQIYYYKQLFKPLMMIAMFLLAVCFIRIRNVRDISQGRELLLAICIGFLVHITSEISITIFVASQMSAMLSVLSTSVIVMLISVVGILYLHEF